MVLLITDENILKKIQKLFVARIIKESLDVVHNLVCS